MSTYLDILIATFIGGMMLLMLHTASNNAHQAFMNNNADAITQQNIARLTQILQHDLRKMGFNVPEKDQYTTIVLAESNRIKFLSHLNGDPHCRMQIPGINYLDNVADTIEYYIYPKQYVTLIDTTIVLYSVQRTITIPPNYQSQMDIGLIANGEVFRYLDQVGRPVANPSATKIVEVTIKSLNPRIVLSPEYVVEQLSQIKDPIYLEQELKRLVKPSYWRQTRLISRNLNR